MIVLGWLVLWQLASWALANPLLLAGPIEVCYSLAANVITVSFWQSVGFSFLRIALGGVSAFFIGVGLALLAHRVPVAREILEPAVSFLKAVPVVCVIVLMLLWVGAAWTSTVIVIMVVFPSVYYAILEALQNINTDLRDMLKVFKVRGLKKFLFFYWPSVLPYVMASSKVAVGMSWKSGIAAELIGIPLGSIGEELYLSKITLATADLFAWTIVIVLVSLLCERAVLFVLARSEGWAKGIALKMQGPARKQSEQKKDAAEVHELSIAYGKNNEEVVVSDFSYRFDSGDTYCIMAPSGSGKTSLLMTMLGLKKPYKGCVSGFEHASAVFQEVRLFETATAVENCKIIAPRDTSTTSIRNLLTSFIPKDKLDAPVSELSGGMRRRVELARALVAESNGIILDEPFTGLDDETRHKTAEVLKKEQAGRTIITSTHNEDDLTALKAIRIPLAK